jgi:hypothetical protein
MPTFVMEVKLDKTVSKNLKMLDTNLKKEIETVHDKCAFNIVSDVVKNCRVDTGRLRASWFPFLDTFGYDYSNIVAKQGNETAEGIAEGKTQGTFSKRPLNTFVKTNVKYAGELEEKTGILKIGTLQGQLPKFYRIYNDTFNDFLKVVDGLILKGKIKRNVP